MTGIEGEPRYVLGRRIGVGGMGEVYLATLRSPAGERAVAVKRLPGRASLDDAARERLIAEARLVFQLTHANICQVIDLAYDDGAFIVMEYVEGIDLRRLIRETVEIGHQVDVAMVVYIAREVARALDYAHRKSDESGRLLQLVHGDVTPQNILLSVEGEVKLTDFGVARALRVAAPGSGILAGTPGYISPDSTGSHDHRVDLYSLGVVLYVALSGCPPGSDEFDMSALARQRPDVSPDLVAIVERATVEHPEERFLSAADLERALARELARRYPDFTPSLLAEMVRRAAPRASAVDVRQGSTLFSMLASSSQLSTPMHKAMIPRRVLERATRTVFVSARPGKLVLLGVVVALLGIGVVFWPRETPSSAPAIVRQAAPPPAPTAQPTAKTEARAPEIAHKRFARPSPKPAYLTVNAVPWGAVYVDGRKVAEETPAYRLPLTSGRHEVRVFFPSVGKYSQTRRVVLLPGETKALGFVP